MESVIILLLYVEKSSHKEHFHILNNISCSGPVEKLKDAHAYQEFKTL